MQIKINKKLNNVNLNKKAMNITMKFYLFRGDNNK